MAKGYWIALEDITDPEGFKAYQAANGPAIAKYRGRFMVRGGTSERPEGKPRSRIAVLEFPTYADAIACYHSPEYQAAKALRDGKCEIDFVIIEGYEGPNPG